MEILHRQQQWDYCDLHFVQAQGCQSKGFWNNKSKILQFEISKITFTNPMALSFCRQLEGQPKGLEFISLCTTKENGRRSRRRRGREKVRMRMRKCQIRERGSSRPSKLPLSKCQNVHWHAIEINESKYFANWFVPSCITKPVTISPCWILVAQKSKL